VEIGDKVLILNENAEGIISKKIGNNFLVLNFSTDFLEEFSPNELILKQIFPLDLIDTKDNLKDKIQLIPEKSIEKEREIDLHFGHLVDRPKDYPLHKILSIQIKYAKKAIIDAKNDKIKKLILIHGKGSGKLEQELIKLLQNTEKITFFDADFQRYKLGAIEIRFL